MLWLLGFLVFAGFVIWNRDLYTFLQFLVLGLPQGGIIALIAVGYSMVYGIIQLINFAHGEVFMMSTYFALMFMLPMGADQAMGMSVITATVGIIGSCAAWVALSALLRNRLIRGVASVAIGLLMAWINSSLIPHTAEETLPFWGAIGIALVYACCLGVSMDLLAYRPLRGSPRLIPLITAIGLSLFMQNFAQSIWGSARRDFPFSSKPTFRPPGDFWPEGTTVPLMKLKDRFGNMQVLDTTWLDITIILVALGLLAALQWFIHYTRTGKAMRACAQDRVTAGLMGIQTNRVVALAFALGATLAAIAAPLYVLRGTFISPTMGYIVGILAFASAVLGGIGNITGAMLGGLIIGIIYTFVPLFDTIDSFRIFEMMEQWGWVTREGWNDLVAGIGRPGQYQLGVAYAFMILVIVFKPTGLLGKASAKRA